MTTLEALYKRPRSLHELLDALREVSDHCDKAEYSLDDVGELRRISVELKARADLLYQCCS